MILNGTAGYVDFNEKDGSFRVAGSGAEFDQWKAPEELRVKDAAIADERIRYTLETKAGDISCSLFYLNGRLRLEMDADFDFEGEIAYPGAFRPAQGDVTVLPMHEGMAFPVDKQDIPLPELREAYCGWYCSLQMWAIVRGDTYLVATLDDSLDAIFREKRDENGRLITQVSHVPEKGKWGYTRAMYFMTGKNGIVGAAKAYRALIREKGRLVTLRQKRKTCPNLDKLMGAANVWMFNSDVHDVVPEMVKNGMDRVLWSSIRSAGDVAYMKKEAKGWLPGRYNIFRDVATPRIRADKPETFAIPEEDRTYMIHSDAYPDDIVVTKEGKHAECWKVHLKDGTMTAMVPICGTQYVKYAIQDVDRDMAKRGYEAYFVDTLPCTTLDECYSPVHPMTRSLDIKWRVAATQYMCDMGLVTGVEDMTDLTVPHAHYSEGLMSVGHYRKENAGYTFQQTYYGDEVPGATDEYELNPEYRVPFFQLIYHDCVAAYWYWGDSDTTFPERMPRRDVFNALYGTLPLYGITKDNWNELKDKMFASYPRATRVHRLTGYDEMTDFIYLTEDKKVQRTRFANGVQVTANLSDKVYTDEDGNVIAPNDYVIKEGTK